MMEEQRLIVMSYGSRTFAIDASDEALIAPYRWRVNLDRQDHRYAVASVQNDPFSRHKKGMIYLHRLIGEAHGIGADRRIGFINGDTLDCRYTNLIDKGARYNFGRLRQQPSGPAGIHRHKMGEDRPATNYLICQGEGHPGGNCERDPVGRAYRSSDSWSFTWTGHQARSQFGRFADGMAWLSSLIEQEGGDT
jgi:hypothetical protein